MSCHHSDGIGNSISDSIPIKPFVELFASLDSGRPQELCASLTMKKRVDITISWILYHKDVKSRIPVCLVSTQYGMSLLDSLQSLLQKELMRKERL